MARDFWSQGFESEAVTSFRSSSGVVSIPLDSTRVVETSGRRATFLSSILPHRFQHACDRDRGGFRRMAERDSIALVRLFSVGAQGRVVADDPCFVERGRNQVREVGVNIRPGRD